MRKPTYVVVTTTVAALGVLGVLSRLASRLLPEPRLNRLQYESAEFLQQASRQEIDWRTLSPQAFREALERFKPVMLVIGTPWSATGRAVDRQLFLDPDVSAFMNRAFLCVRIDAQQTPEWMNSYLPLSRPPSGLVPGFQIWFLTPDGALFDSLSVKLESGPLDPQPFLASLFEIADRFAREGGSASTQSVIASQNKREQELLLGGVEESTPSFERQDEILESLALARPGGFPASGRASPRGSAFRYLLLRGRFDLFTRSLDPLLTTPLIDWIDGGFFAAISGEERPQVEFDKIAVQNAEMMAVLAVAGQMTRNGVYKRIASGTFDSLTEEFMQGGLIAACRVGDGGGRGRSAWSSFSPRELREALSPEDRDWLRTHMTMRVEENPAMAMAARDPAYALGNLRTIREIQAKLAASKKKRPALAGFGQMDVNGFVSARLSATARLWNDPKRLQIAAELFDRLEALRAGDDVEHSLDPAATQASYLGDYLAYADAALNDFLATGRTLSLNLGLRVLERAQTLFEVPGKPAWKLRYKEPEQPAPKDTGAAEVIDVVRESCTAQAIRLLAHYGWLCNRTDLVRRAERMVVGYGSLSKTLAFWGSGYFCASLQVLDDRRAFSVGRNADRLASDLYRLVPTRLVAPAIGDVRTDLQTKPEGIYVVERGSTFGPLDLSGALARLSPALKPR